jgi:hypothetical protein
MVPSFWQPTNISPLVPSASMANGTNFFWSHVKAGEIAVLKINTHHQCANYLTKGLTREIFEHIHELLQGW